LNDFYSLIEKKNKFSSYLSDVFDVEHDKKTKMQNLILDI